MAGIAAAVIGAVGSIGGGILSSKGSKEKDGFVAPLNPGFNTLLDLFGAQLKTRGRVKGVFDDPNNEGVFESADFKDSIRKLIFDAPGLSDAERQLAEGYLGGDAPARDLAEAQERLGALLGNAEELTNTGFRTNARPAYEEAVRRLRENILPEIANIAGQQVGVSSSSFLDSANRASADLLGEASLQQLNLDEAAASRRASGLGLYGSLIGTRLGLQPAFANDLLALGGSIRNVINTQQSRPLNVFASLTGLGNAQPFGVSGFNPAGSGTTQLLEGLAGAIKEPGVQEGLGKLLGGIFGGGGGDNSDVAFGAVAGPNGPVSTTPSRGGGVGNFLTSLLGLGGLGG